MLSLVIWLPVIGAVLIGILPGFSRSIALAAAGASLLGTLVIAGIFNYQDAGLQLVEHLNWVDPLPK